MGKNKSASNLVNVIDFNNDRIAFISGSTTLMSISSSGAITTTGVISGSNAASASYALNAGLLNNKNSAEFTSTGSFNAYTASNDATVTSVAMSTVTALSAIATLASKTGSYTLTSSFNSYTASNNTTMSCVSSTATSAIVGVGALASKTGSYATTGSNTFAEGAYFSSSYNPTGFSTTASLYTDGGLRVSKDAYISGTLYLNNVTVYGTQSVCYITSSQLNISSNLISVNTSTPSVRFGGLSVYDSGSTGLTGSILWDSENNRWIYSNPSGSSYDGGMFISGPRNSSGLGSETGTTACMLLAGQGGDHLTSSMIYHSSTVTCIPNAIVGGTACFSGAVCSSYLSVKNSDNSILARFSGAGDYAIFAAGANAPDYQATDMNAVLNLGTRCGGNAYLSLAAKGGALFALSGGCVGIGTPSPIASLQICSPDGQLRLSGDGRAQMILNTYAKAWQFETSCGAGNVSACAIGLVEAGAGARFQIAPGGVACFSSKICAPTYNFTGAPNSCIHSDASYTYFVTSNATRFDIDVSGIATFACRVCVNTLTLGLNASNIFTRSNGSTYCRFLYAGSNLHVLFSGGTTANNGAFGVNNFEDTDRIFNMLNNGVSTFTNTVCSPKFWSTGDVNAAGTANAKYFRDYYIGAVYSTFAQHANPSPGTYQAFCASQGAVLYITSMHNNGRSTTIVNYSNGITGGMAFTVVNQTSAYSPANITISAGGSGWLCIYYPYGGPTDFMAQVMGGTHTWGSSLTS
jgi:hypothetical protein